MGNPRILVVDEGGALDEKVRGAARGMPGRVEVVACSSLDHPLASAPFDVLVAGEGLDDEGGVQRLESFRAGHPYGEVVLVFPHRPQVALRQVVRVGAVDLLCGAVRSDSLRSSLARALALGGDRAGPPAAAPQPGRVITVASATGGCGKTFYAVNAAYFLQHHTGGRVCIVDLDLQFGEVTTALRLRPRFTIFDTRRQGAEAGDGDLSEHLEEYMVEHHTGVWVLPAPDDPGQADRIDPPDVLRVIEAARRRFDYVIVDTPAALTETVLAALDVSEVLFVLATLDLPSVRNLGVFLATLEKLRVPSDVIRLVMNKAEAGLGLRLADVAELFPRGFSSTLPYAREVSQSVNAGEPVLARHPQADVSRRLAQGLAVLLPEGARAAHDAHAGAPPRRRFRAGLARLARPRAGARSGSPALVANGGRS